MIGTPSWYSRLEAQPIGSLKDEESPASARLSEARPRGFEPLTFGSVDRRLARRFGSIEPFSLVSLARNSPETRRSSAERHCASAHLRARRPLTSGFMTDKNIDRAKGRAKEAAGALTGNRRLKNEGRVDQAKSSVKNAVDAVTGRKRHKKQR